MSKAKSAVLLAVPLLFRNRIAKGVDWGVERLVLARVDGKELWWIKGQMVWNGRGYDRLYNPASAELVLEPDVSGLPKSIEFKPARRSKKFFQENAAKINEFFGCDVASLLRPDATIVRYGEVMPRELGSYDAWLNSSIGRPIPCLPEP